ncbi:hypothetical protein C7S17_5097 [Burkholderia thailandensis]|nr:hypothetical protein [Burkholderia thailandensis]
MNIQADKSVKFVLTGLFLRDFLRFRDYSMTIRRSTFLT